MDFKNCKKCGRLFKAVGNQVECSRCRDTEVEDFKTVREYIYDHPNANIVEISEETGVPEKKILKYLRDGKLKVKGEGILLKCEKCGEGIDSGRYCSKCKNDLKNGFKAAIEKDMAKDNTSDKRGGMYTRKK